MSRNVPARSSSCSNTLRFLFSKFKAFIKGFSKNIVLHYHFECLQVDIQLKGLWQVLSECLPWFWCKSLQILCLFSCPLWTVKGSYRIFIRNMLKTPQFLQFWEFWLCLMWGDQIDRWKCNGWIGEPILFFGPKVCPSCKFRQNSC